MEAPCKKLRLFENTPVNCILSWRIKSFEDIVHLSTQSFGCLYSKVKSHDLLNIFTIKYKLLLETCHTNIVKIYIIFHSFTVDQQRIFLKIHETFRLNTFSASCIDASPGTGKTFLIALLLLSFKHPIHYLVYTKKLVKQMSMLHHDGKTETCCKFLMHVLDINYFKAKNIWTCCVNSTYLTLEEKCKEVLCYIKNIDKSKVYCNVYILDEDSVISPWFIFFLYMFAKYMNVHVLFIGDKYQQSSINKTIYHNACNFTLINALSQNNTYFLTNRVRQNDDAAYKTILETITNIFKENDNNKERLMTFDIKFKLYMLLKDHFFIKENFSATFISQYHRNIKNRLLRYKKYLENKNMSFSKMPFCQKRKNIFKAIDQKLSNDKFMPYLLLVLDTKYIYCPNNGETVYTTILRKITTSYLICDILELQRTVKIQRVLIQPTFMAEEHISWLHEHIHGAIYQFPLKYNVSTYHAAQGLTLTIKQIELDLDASTLNSFYVGLTRVTQQKQIGRIHTTELINFVFTEKQNDEFFYRLSPLYIKNMKFENCQSISVFSNKNLYRNLRIPREKFKTQLQEEQTTNMVKMVNVLLKVQTL